MGLCYSLLYSVNGDLVGLLRTVDITFSSQKLPKIISLSDLLNRHETLEKYSFVPFVYATSS